MISVSATPTTGPRSSLLLLQPIPTPLPASGGTGNPIVVGCVHAAIRFACKEKAKLQLQLQRRVVMRMTDGAFCLAVVNALERTCALKPACLLPFVTAALESHSACTSANDRVKHVQVTFNMCSLKNYSYLPHLSDHPDHHQLCINSRAVLGSSCIFG